MAAFAPRVPCSHAALRCSRPLRVPSAAIPLANRPARQQCIRVQCQAAQVQEAPAVETAPAFVIDTGKVTVFNAPQFDQLTAAAGSRLVVVDVYTTWCGPCKMIAPELEKFAAELGDRMVMTKIDCTSNNDNKKWAMAQNVKALPTFILFKDGKRVNDMTGAKAANLRKLIDAHI